MMAKAQVVICEKETPMKNNECNKINLCKDFLNFFSKISILKIEFLNNLSGFL